MWFQTRKCPLASHGLLSEMLQKFRTHQFCSIIVDKVYTPQAFKGNVARLELHFEDTVGNGNFLSIILSCEWVMSQSEMGTDLNRGMLSSDNVVLLMHLPCLTIGERHYFQWNNNLWEHKPGKHLPTISNSHITVPAPQSLLNWEFYPLDFKCHLMGSFKESLLCYLSFCFLYILLYYLLQNELVVWNPLLAWTLYFLTSVNPLMAVFKFKVLL